jgi:hypothetical protein
MWMMHDVVHVFVLFCIKIEHEFKVVYLYTCNGNFVVGDLQEKSL